MAKKDGHIHARVRPKTVAQLTALRLHHAREGRLEMSKTRILEELIEKEAKRLKVEVIE